MEGDDIVIKWQTASEQNSNHFNVQVSKDGKEFTTIATVKAAGTTNIPQNYQYAYPKTSYSQLLSVATLLLVSIGRPKKYLVFASLAFLMLICSLQVVKKISQKFMAHFILGYSRLILMA